MCVCSIRLTCYLCILLCYMHVKNIYYVHFWNYTRLDESSHSSRQLLQKTCVHDVTMGSSTRFLQIGHSKSLILIDGTTKDMAK